ncbi:hypothetical protein [Brevifollis gellanilyticus]|uniref:DUF5666 domain-containing protein n=1 Tax=Brevifollis gellanilyticus TaxID=748831 RepID=A0A512MJL2_9BACT|nr:hypothetical protein [Brevifollis gellanilyticus]GEP46491.1 hypothetical protein BGE01nite_57820 [Brevifollis gellanilyticus]
MKTTLLLAAVVSLSSSVVLAQNETVTRGVDVKGADVKGSDVKGADVKGPDVKGPDVHGGTVTGGTVTGGSVTGGSVSGGTVTQGTVTPGLVTAFAEGREIRVSSAQSATVNVNGATAQVKLGEQMLSIEKARIVLDGKPLANLPEATKQVQVDVKDSMLIIKGDGKEVTRSKVK